MLRQKSLQPFLPPLLGGFLLFFACNHPLWASRPARLVGDFGSHTLYQTLIGLAVVLLLWRVGLGGPKRLLWWLPNVALALAGCVEGLKWLTRLPRPDGDPTGFPSGHTTVSFAVAWLLTRLHPALAPLWYALAISVGWSRIEGHAHFPYQVLWGAVLGTIIGALVSRAPALPPSSVLHFSRRGIRTGPRP